MDKVNNSPVSTPTILTDIIQARTNIKQKYNALKTGKFETDALINNTFSSIIGPLNEIKSDNKKKPFQAASPPPPLSGSVTPHVDSTVNGSLPHLHSAPATYKDLNARFGPWTKPVLDKIYGPVKLSDGVFRLGDKELQFFDNVIHIEGDTRTYPTSAHQTSDGLRIRKSKGQKSGLISNLFSRKSNNIKGAGISMRLQKHNITYWNDPNELVDRLRLLYSSFAAGNTGVRNEIISICEELVEAKILKKIPNV
ncbi:hypothetical protein QTP88_001313 [Uroleucon formosanum]